MPRVKEIEKDLEPLLKIHTVDFIQAVANVLERNCKDLEVENHDEIDDAVHALRYSLTPYAYDPDDEDDEDFD